MEEFYTVEEIAKTLKIQVPTIREWLRQGKLQGIKFGKQWRIRRRDFEEFIEAANKGGKRR